MPIGSYSEGILVYIKDNAHFIKKYSDIIGVPPEAVAGVIAEEDEYWGYKDRLFEWAHYIVTAVGSALGSDADKHEFIKESYENTDSGLWDMPLGKGSVRVKTALTLLIDYLHGARKRGDIIDNAAYNLLVQYENDYYQFVLDLKDENKPVAFVMCAIMLKKAEEFYSNQELGNVSESDWISQDYYNMIQGSHGYVPFAWQMLNQDRRNAIMITYFNIGWAGASSKIDIPRMSSLPKTAFHGIGDDSVVYGFPQYFPQPGPDESGGVLYLEYKEELRKRLDIFEDTEPYFTNEFLAIARIVFRNEANAEDLIKSLNALLELQEKVFSLSGPIDFTTFLQKAEAEWGYHNASIIQNIDNVIFENLNQVFTDNSKSDMIFGFENKPCKIIGGNGNDYIYSGKGDDILYGDDENNVFEGQDYLYGGGGDDRLYGGRGDDYLDGGEDNDRLEGGQGNDSYIVGQGWDRIWDSDDSGKIYYGSFDEKNRLTGGKITLVNGGRHRGRETGPDLPHPPGAGQEQHHGQRPGSAAFAGHGRQC
ncbi:MAG: hypothetical protein LBL79_03000, partial [Prevotella sp.]|nr:hypothetical protein [Prevotella sp.]